MARRLHRMSLALSKLRSRKCDINTRYPPCHKATWPRLSKANWYLDHPSSNRPSSIAWGCTSYSLVLGVIGSIALAKGGGSYWGRKIFEGGLS